MFGCSHFQGNLRTSNLALLIVKDTHSYSLKLPVLINPLTETGLVLALAMNSRCIWIQQQRRCRATAPPGSDDHCLAGSGRTCRVDETTPFNPAGRRLPLNMGRMGTPLSGWLGGSFHLRPCVHMPCLSGDYAKSKLGH